MKPEIKWFDEVPFIASNEQPNFKELPQRTREIQEEIKTEAGRELDLPFVRYITVGNMTTVNVSMGFTTRSPVQDTSFITGHLPAGRYLIFRHMGSYDTLIDTNRKIQEWAKENNVEFQTEQSGEDEVWVSRLEVYIKGPDNEKDPQQWITEVRYLIR